MNTFENLQLGFNKELNAYHVGSHPKNLYGPVHYTLSMGGKRLRPVLLLMAAEAFGGNTEHAMPAALAIEIFHNSTLVHDDIMDKADLRRNQPTVHREWNTNIAILSGDLMILKSYEALNKLDTPHLSSVLSVFNRITAQVCEGQQLDLDFENNNEVNISDYMDMIRLKTSVLLAGALEIGAIIGGASKEDAKKIYCFGEHLGLAFQLQDDFLDAFGNKNTFGKKIGGDIVANKKTYLLLKALELTQGPYRDQLTSLMNNKSIDENEKIAQVLQIYKGLKIKELAEDAMLKHYDKAFASLKDVQLDEIRKHALYQVSEKLIHRES
ncbi:MAG: polyprenyl synthetase family protein [Salinivirgaceae bacterium]|jgi:geranylgeranyl diphosphate synthase type II|nr:polyprenyl synthetase family protein [Salinivirgaceae bacterium]